jgi:hypothetical protein
VGEADYWVSLEYRVCREFAGMAERRLRWLWCDGFIPQQYLISEETPRVVGRAWIGDGPSQHEWEFTLFLPHPAGSRDEIDWASLLPPEDVTRWLAVDLANKRIQVEPLAAVSDPVEHCDPVDPLARAADLGC